MTAAFTIGETYPYRLGNTRPIEVANQVVGDLLTTWNEDRWWAINAGSGHDGQPTIITRVHFTSAEDAAADLVAMLEALK